MSVTTVRDNLIALRQSVGNFIVNEMGHQNGVEMNNHLEAARDVSLGIENAMVAYDYPPVLDLPPEKVTAVVRKKLQQLQEIVTLLESKNSREVVGLGSRVHQFISSLKLASWQPHLAGTWPRQVYVVGHDFEVSFAGLFEDAAAYKAAHLVIGEKLFTLTKAANDRLTFKVQLPPNYLPDTALKNCHMIKAQLEVDYNLGSWTSFAKKAHYEVFIGMFPLSAGEAKVEYYKSEVIGEDKRTIRATITKTVSLKWGEPFVFELLPFTITLKTIDGQDGVLTETQKVNGCFRVAEVDGKYQLVATPPIQP